MSFDWTDERIAQLRKWRSKSVSLEECAERFGDGCTYGIVKSKCNMLHIKSYDRRNISEDFLGSDEKDERAKLEVCSALHLQDLLDAGHDPKQTEFIIANERRTPMTYTPRASYLGSPAAMCADGMGGSSGGMRSRHVGGH
jgi:hypothetical protein